MALQTVTAATCGLRERLCAPPAGPPQSNVGGQRVAGGTALTVRVMFGAPGQQSCPSGRWPPGAVERRCTGGERTPSGRFAPVGLRAPEGDEPGPLLPATPPLLPGIPLPFLNRGLVLRPLALMRVRDGACLSALKAACKSRAEAGRRPAGPRPRPPMRDPAANPVELPLLSFPVGRAGAVLPRGSSSAAPLRRRRRPSCFSRSRITGVTSSATAEKKWNADSQAWSAS
mmetsp:Transcript_69604/g.207408  ORF Transcript_69604/g.207408 Transcript_69604/m.207408 type:complete len:229 (-) Transcript_69604:409-1095(-)